MTVSLLITTHNRTDLLKRSLETILDPRRTKPEEFFIIDDGGEDGCCATLDIGIPISARCYYFDNPGETNCCKARNAGLRLATQDVLITSEPEVEFISDVVDQLGTAQMVSIASGDKVIWYPEKCLHDLYEGCTFEECTNQPGWPFCNAWPRRVLTEIGGWDETLPGPWGFDDIDLHERLRYLGYEFLPLPDCIIHHQWHPSRIEPAVENEAHVRGKEFPRDLVANR